jgi:hypothetical protein
VKTNRISPVLVPSNSLLEGSENQAQFPLGFPQTTPRGAWAPWLNPVTA